MFMVEITARDGTVIVERRQSVLSAVSASKWYLIAAMVLSLATVAAVMAILLAQTLMKQPLETAGVYLVMSITAPVIASLLAAAGIGVVNVLDGYQNQLMRAIGEKEHAKGVIEGLKENKDVNIS